VKKLVEEVFNRLGLGYTEAILSDCTAFLNEMERWSSFTNLVGRRDPSALAGHLLDSLAALPVIRRVPVQSAADAGSGGGFPGIPLAICMPETRMSLIERSGKKAGFLRNASALLSCRERLCIVQEDLRKVGTWYDLVVCRALAALSPGLELLWPLTAPGGRLIFYKGRAERIEAELDSAFLPVNPEIIPLSVPGQEGERSLVVFRRDQ